MLYSEPGDYIGQGQNWDVWYEPETAASFFTSSPYGFVDGKPALLYFTFSNFGDTIAERSTVTLFFGTNAMGVPLVPGFYDDARRAAFAPPGHPGLDVSFQHRGSNTLTGNFTVKEFTYTGNATDGFIIQSFVASFEQHSEGADPALFGHFTYRAVPEPSSIAAIGLGGLALLARRRRRKA